MSPTGEEEPSKILQRFIDYLIEKITGIIKDKFAIIAIVIIVIIFISLYFVFRGTSLYTNIENQIGGFLELIWAGLTFAANLGYTVIKKFRNKVLFRDSASVVKANKGPKVLLWILDGCSVQAFQDVAKSNKDLKTFYEEGYFAQCVTIFPSITPAAHSAILTGCYPSKTRVPAFDWVEVKSDYAKEGENREYIRCMPDFKRFKTQFATSKYQKEFFKGLGDAFALNQRFLSPFVYTVFETLGEDWYTISLKEWIHRGADSFFSASVNDTLKKLTSANIIKQNSMINLMSALFKEVNYEFGDLLWGSETYQKLADLTVYWKTGTDTKSHEYGPNSKQVREEIHEAIDKLAETIRFYKMHSNQPIYVIITSDHSQSEVTEFSNLLAEFKEDTSDKYRVADREDRSFSDRINNADIIVANNDRAAFFYAFGEQQTKNMIRAEIIDYLKVRKEVDLIFYLEDDQKKVIQVCDDGLFLGPEDINVFFKGKEMDYPNAIERIEGLMKGNKWGDVIVSMKEGYSLNPDFKPEKEGEKILHGDHGGLNFNDSIGPLLIWGPTIKSNKKDDKLETFRTVDITPIIAKIFKLEHKPADGRVPEEVFL